MALTLHILGTGAQADRQKSIVMQGDALTIGRADGNDLVLPDPDREISSNHAVLQTHGSDFVVLDISTNGTFLNAETTPLGAMPSPLNNGDVLRIGAYELRVEIDVYTSDPLDDLPPPVGEEQLLDAAEFAGKGGDVFAEVASLDHDGGDFLDDLLGAAPPNAMNTPTPELVLDGQDLVDEFLDIAPDANLEGGASAPNHSAASHDFFAPGAGENAIPDDWDDDFLSGDQDPFAPIAPAEETPPVAPVQEPVDLVEETTPPPEPAPVEPVAEPVVKAPNDPVKPDAARIFLQAAGLDDSRIADDELSEIMARSGEVFRTLIEGARDVLMARTGIKDELNLQKTTISPDGNNPIKFSISGLQAVEAMIKPTVPGYKPAPDAAREAMKDIKAHEVAMMSGMETAIKGLLARFDPDVLAQKLQADGGRRGLLKGKKARYWEVFEQMYGQISQEAAEDYNTLFGKEFSKAYEAQLRAVKQADKKD